MTRKEQRRSPRRRVSEPAWWSRPGDSHPSGAWLLERSATGVAFITRADALPAAGALVELAETPDGPGVIARVCRVRRAHWDLFVVAAQFEGSVGTAGRAATAPRRELERRMRDPGRAAGR